MDKAILKSHVEKPEKFKGSDIHRSQQKMLFYLTSLHVSYVLTDSEPVDPYMVDGENVPTEAQMAEYERAASQWNHNEYNCRNYILNALDDSLYDIYSTIATAMEIWESLEKKYRTQVACSKKFIVGKFVNFKMNDAKPVVKQVEELQIIVHEIEVEGMDNMMLEKADANSIEPNANLVRESSSKSKSNHKNKGKNGGGSGQKYSKDGKKDYTQQKNNNLKKVYHCWVCGKPGHKAKDFRHKKEHGGRNSRGNSNRANHVQSPKEFAEVIESFLTTNVVEWWYDTGCTKHICNSLTIFVSYQKVNELELMFMGNETSSKIEGKGKVILKLTSGKDLVLSNVLHVPNITKNLISGPILSNKGFKLVIESDKLVITKGGVYVGKGYLDEGLFKLSVVTDDNVINNNNAGTSTASVYMIDPSFLWHSRLGHVNFRSLQRMINLGMLPKCSKDKISKCEICVESKYTSHSHKSVEKSNEILGLIHTDLCDFKATPSRGGKNYYITFIDDCSKFCYVYLINTKDEALNMFKTYKAEVENQLDKKIKILRSDRGGEYESNDFAEFCSTFGIVHQTTAPYTPQQNGVAERKNRTLKNMINSMLITSGAPHSLWGEACLAANTILNKIPYKKSDKSPYQLWKGKQPSYKRMKVWGCLAKVQIPLPKRTKLGPKIVDCVYLGPTKNSVAYRFLVYKSNIEDISNNTIIESAEADFFENIFPYKDKEKQILNPRKRVMNHQLSQDETNNNSEIP
ncbi:retrovirus-related pol polyprotein from transposon TNT 1-94 [Tanacetum coccineum]